MATNLQLRSMLTLESQPGPFISIFEPLDDVRNQDFVKNLSNRVKSSFNNKYPDKDWSPYQAKFDKLKIPRMLGSRNTKALAIYVGPTILKVFKLNHEVNEAIIMDDTMKIIELIIDTQFKHIQRSHRLFNAAIKNIKVHYHESSQIDMTTDKLDDIVKLAPAGRIDALIINSSASLEAKYHILNDLAITVIGFGGNVFLLNNDEMPNNKGVVVIKRG
ncbi:hypothetical protein MOO44_03450 [Nicoliella spurrieriana]|uniref:Uncharacterized protein n=1 Tax=Nicoliella spurrieriana TaxID=2925830 RepID=A0A976X687_9LACO|nr:hypothetical protein [Nicoliella spurrieriana]UQS87227.1 hypothetical protein MOO44_03450 [Nicoliella spurrieriana]